MNFSRRNFLFVSSGAATGTMLVSGISETEAAEGIDFSASGLVTGKPKPLRQVDPRFPKCRADRPPPHRTLWRCFARLFGTRHEAGRER